MFCRLYEASNVPSVQCTLCLKKSARGEKIRKKIFYCRTEPRTRDKGKESEITEAGGDCPQAWLKRIIMIIPVDLERVVGAKYDENGEDGDGRKIRKHLF